MRAIVVLPTPRVPENRKACAIRLLAMAFERVWTTCGWPMTSWNVAGRYFLAET